MAFTLRTRNPTAFDFRHLQHPRPENVMKTLADAFEHTLKDMYYAENALLKAIPVTAAAATNKDLKQSLKEHLAETKAQVETLKKVFKSIGKKPAGEKCDAIEGLIKECEGVIEEGEK